MCMHDDGHQFLAIVFIELFFVSVVDEELSLLPASALSRCGWSLKLDINRSFIIIYSSAYRNFFNFVFLPAPVQLEILSNGHTHALKSVSSSCFVLIYLNDCLPLALPPASPIDIFSEHHKGFY